MDPYLLLITVMVILIAMFSAAAVYLRCIVIIPPDKALVIYGKGEKALKYKFFLKGKKFVSPITESYGFLPTKVFTLKKELMDLWTKDQNRVQVSMVARYSLRTDQDGLEKAAQNFFKKDEDAIKSAFEAQLVEAAALTFKAHDLSDLGHERDGLSKEWAKRADEGLWPLGLAINPIIIKDIQDKGVVVTDIPTMKAHLKDLKSELAELEDKLSTIEKAK